jgi:hypothetical protein
MWKDFMLMLEVDIAFITWLLRTKQKEKFNETKENTR